ncbi:GEVED domain-containing protein, partial [Hyunsoonleella aestuarii]|uniref:GEVED domain-containing protein n=1 Tax=Hyunsoonleella aestuarii TaxID=912802 RepID=UPI0031E1A40A
NPATDVDQTFDVLPAPCLQPPTGLAASNIAPSSATISWNNVSGATYNYRYRKSGTTTWTTLSTSNTSEIVSGLEDSTQYDVEVNSVCPDTSNSVYSATYNFTTAVLSYCTSNGSTENSTGATRVVFVDIDNSDTNNTDNAYEDFTSINTDVIKGSNHSLTVDVDTNGNKTVHAIAWIDFDRDGAFNTTDEQFDLGSVKNGTSLSPTSTSITIPSGAATGIARMRISVKFNMDPTSCETGFNGEVEDYSINILDPCTDLDGDGYTTCDGDCDDSIATGFSINPGATEICDGIDNNCDGNIDEGLTLYTYYVDADGDGSGSTTTAMLCASSAPAGYSSNNTDCNDSDDTVNTPQQYYVDADGDGFGSTTTAMLCASSAPAGYSANNTDCNDSDDTVNTPQQYYVDADGDGFGSTTTAMLCASSAPAGYSANNTDCNDSDDTVNTPQQYYVDADGDGFGSTTTAMLCASSAPAGYSANNTDCNDSDDTVNTPQQYYVDADGDGFGSTTTAMLCASSAPAGYSANNTDCNDSDDTVNTPQQYYVDADGDGFG